MDNDDDDDYEALLSELDGISTSPVKNPAPAASPMAGGAGRHLPAAPSPARRGASDTGGVSARAPAPSSMSSKPPRVNVGKLDKSADLDLEIDGLLGELDNGGAGDSPRGGDSSAGERRAGGAGPEVERGAVDWVTMGVAEEQGQRPTMEDQYIMNTDFCPIGISSKVEGARALAGVLDGHSGPEVAAYAARRLPEILTKESWYKSDQNPTKEAVTKSIISAFDKVDSEILQKAAAGSMSGGATANAMLLIGNTIYVANLGDTRAVISRSGMAVPLSEDHKPDHPAERRRIEELDGRVEWRGCWRVIGTVGAAAFRGLAVSRAFGDVDWKVPVPLVEARPEVTTVAVTPFDEFLIIGCDGVWDVLSNQEAIDIAREHIVLPEAGGAGGRAAHKGDDLGARAAAQAIADTALEKGTQDNVTVVVVEFHRD